MIACCWQNVSAQWDLVYDGSNDMGHVDMHFFDADTGYVIGASSSLSSYLLKTTDGGVSWDTTLFAVNDWCKSIDFPSRDTGYISFFNSFLINVYRTIDGGDSWVQVSSDIEVGSPAYMPIRFYDNKTGVLAPDLSEAWITEDGGISWSQLPGIVGNALVILNGISIISSGNGYSLSYDTMNTSAITNGVFLNASITDNDLYFNGADSAIALSSTGQGGTSIGYPYLNYGAISISSDLGETWMEHHFPYMNSVRTIIKTDQYYYAGTASTISEQQFLKSEDGGLTWYTQSSTEPGGTSSVWINDMQCLNDTVCYALGAGGNIYKTTNGGGPLITQVGFPFTGINDLYTGAGKLNVWPNPSEGVFVVELEALKQVQGDVTIEVMNVTGKAVRRMEVGNANTIEVDLSDEPNGVYYLTHTTSGGTNQRLIIKQ